MIPCNYFVCKNSQNPHFYARDKLQQRIPKNEQNIEGENHLIMKLIFSP